MNTNYSNLLPDEILIKIFEYCEVDDLTLRMRKVCDRWREIIKDKQIWEKKTFYITPWLADVTEEILQSAPLLKSITVYANTDQIMNCLCETNSIPNLTCIRFMSSQTVSKEFLKRFLHKHRNIKIFGMLMRDINPNDYIDLICELRNVEEIKLSYSGREKGVVKKILTLCPQLIKIDLAGTGYFWLSDEDLEAIVDVKKDSLQYLSLDGVLLTSKSLDLLSKCYRLKHLNVGTSQVSEEKFIKLNHFHVLRSLHLHQAQNISSNVYIKFFNSSNLKNLQELKLFHCSFNDASTSMLVQNCQLLRVLKLQNIVDEDDINFQAVDCDVISDKSCTDASLSMILDNLFYLDTLELFSKYLTDKYFSIILEKLRKLIVCRIEGKNNLFVWPTNARRLETLLQYH